MHNLHELLYLRLSNILEKIKEEVENRNPPYEEDNEGDLDQKLDALDVAIDRLSRLQTGEAFEDNSREIVDNLLSTQVFDFTGTTWNLFKKITALIAFVEESEIFDPAEQLNQIFNEFTIKELNDDPLPLVCFSHANEEDAKRSMAYINFGFNISGTTPDVDISDLKGKLNGSNLTPQILAWMVHHLPQQQEANDSSQYIFFHSDFANDANGIENVKSALKVQAVLQNKVLHSPKDATKPSLDIRYFNRLSPAYPYQQFNELLIILSEYNESSDVIRAFLCLYHVIESFMIKVPIATLARENSGDIFSIRDFRRLYDNIDRSEMSSIESLFGSAGKFCGSFWQRQIFDKKFSQIVEERRKDFTDNLDPMSQQRVDDFIKKLNSKSFNSFQEFKQPNSFNAKKYAQLIYSIRCAVVHNKETEHHISYFNLESSVSDLFNAILIDPMMNLFANLLTDETSPVWYHGSSIKLY